MQKTENKPLYYTNTRIKSKWIKDFNISCETVKILGKKTQAVKSQAFLVAIFFSDISPWAKETKEKNKEMGLHLTKKFLHSNENSQQMKRKPIKIEWENIFANDRSDKGLIFKMYKER